MLSQAFLYMSSPSAWIEPINWQPAIATHHCLRLRCETCAGCLHPDYDGYFETPAQYLKWYIKQGPLKDKPNAPTVAVLLYRQGPCEGQLVLQQEYFSAAISRGSCLASAYRRRAERH